MTSLCQVVRRARVAPDPADVTQVSPRERWAATCADPVWLDAAWQHAEALYQSGIHPAVQLCVRHRGTIVLDRSVGHARGEGPGDNGRTPSRLLTPDTPFCTLSASKAVTAILIHLLVERGAFGLDDAVSRFVPEFARHGKGAITIRHVLGHGSGVPEPDPASLALDRLGDPEATREAIYDLRPATAPGSTLAYHAVTGGFILGEVAERVTGRSMRRLLAEELAGPLACLWLGYGVDPDDVSHVAENYFTGLPISRVLSARFRTVLGFDFPGLVDVSNDPRFLTGVVPAANVVATANDLSRFYQMLLDGGAVGGTQVLKPETIRTATAVATSGEFDRTLLAPIPYGLGFMLGGEWLSLYGPGTPRAFGHLGFTNIVAWADPEREVAAALLTSGKPFVYPALHHWLDVPRCITRACPRIT